MIAVRLSSTDVFYDEKSGTPMVVPLRQEHLDNAYASIDAAFKDDPIASYVNEGAKKPGPRRQAISKRLWKIKFGRSMKRKLAYTVNAGDAVLVATPAKKDVGKKPPVERAIDFALDATTTLFGYLNNSRKQMKRFNEAKTKMEKLHNEKLGDSAAEMIYIDLLATKPESQGQGYGSALLQTILFTADIQGRSVYLFSSNTANTPFYESFGLSIIGQLVLGDDNPKWHKPPVIVPLMVRKPGGGNNDV
ncbi:hypothetical protein M0805_006959 [Coniferiporia weirii]|nr:hypothetical protein M0805_006959 [Coniferiporia weirii]